MYKWLLQLVNVHSISDIIQESFAAFSTTWARDQWQWSGHWSVIGLQPSIRLVSIHQCLSSAAVPGCSGQRASESGGIVWRSRSGLWSKGRVCWWDGWSHYRAAAALIASLSGASCPTGWRCGGLNMTNSTTEWGLHTTCLFRLDGIAAEKTIGKQLIEGVGCSLDMWTKVLYTGDQKVLGLT